MPRILLAAADLAAVYEARGQDIRDADSDDEQVASALRRAGAQVAIATWHDAGVDWAAADAVVVRSAWDYQFRRDEFVDWAARVDDHTLLVPDADVVRWNTHKSYLLELEDRGAPTVPTAWLAAGDRVVLADVAADRRWPEVVAKPAIGAGSQGLVVATDPVAAQDDFQDLLDHHDVMVQPFLHRLATDGELSVVCIDGRVSHAVRKVPAAGEVRVQLEFGGRYERVDLDPSEATLAEWLVAATGVDPVFARVDLVPADDGTWQVAEVELVDPSLYLPWSPGADDRLAAALLDRIAANVVGA